MRGSRGIIGILLGLASGLAFGAGGAVVKPLLESGWSPGAAVFLRVSVAALLLLVPGLVALRFDLRPLWRAKWTVLVYSVIAVAGVQLAFYASIARIPVSTALLIEYLAPVALVAFAWVRTRRAPQWVVLAGSVVAIAGLVLVIGPAGGAIDPIGIALAGIAMLGVAVYYVLGARDDLGVPPIALAASGVFIGAIVLGLAGLTGLVPLRVRAHRHAVPRRHRPVVGARAHRRRRLDRVRVRGRHPGHPHARHEARIVPRPVRGRLRRRRRVGAARRGDRPGAAARRRAHPRRHRARATRAARSRARAARDRPRSRVARRQRIVTQRTSASPRSQPPATAPAPRHPLALQTRRRLAACGSASSSCPSTTGPRPRAMAPCRRAGVRPRVDLRPPLVARTRRRALARDRADAHGGGHGDASHRARHLRGVAQLPAPGSVREGHRDRRPDLGWTSAARPGIRRHGIRRTRARTASAVAA